MILVCVNNKKDDWHCTVHLTIGKKYYSDRSYDGIHHIVDNSGYVQSYKKCMFISLEEHRQKQLERIGI